MVEAHQAYAGEPTHADLITYLQKYPTEGVFESLKQSQVMNRERGYRTINTPYRELRLMRPNRKRFSAGRG